MMFGITQQQLRELKQTGIFSVKIGTITKMLSYIRDNLQPLSIFDEKKGLSKIDVIDYKTLSKAFVKTNNNHGFRKSILCLEFMELIKDETILNKKRISLTKLGKEWLYTMKENPHNEHVGLLQAITSEKITSSEKSILNIILKIAYDNLQTIQEFEDRVFNHIEVKHE